MALALRSGFGPMPINTVSSWPTEMSRSGRYCSAFWRYGFTQRLPINDRVAPLSRIPYPGRIAMSATSTCGSMPWRSSEPSALRIVAMGDTGGNTVAAATRAKAKFCCGFSSTRGS